MKKLIGAFFLIFVACLVAPTLVAGDPGINISGATSFGSVTIGYSSTTIITITIEPILPGLPCEIYNINIIGSPDFSITSARLCAPLCYTILLPIKDLPIPHLPPPDLADLEIDITYTPSSIGDATATLSIDYFDGLIPPPPPYDVTLSGTGVSPPVEGPLFSNVLGILPMAILVSAVVVLRRRRKITPTN